jgi:hypothetical protein
MRLSDLHRRVSVQALTDPDYQAILNYATSQGYSLPSNVQQILQNQLVKDLKAIGVWGKLDIFYCFATDGDRDFAKINWIDQAFANATEVNNPTFVINKGFESDGLSSRYLSTNSTQLSTNQRAGRYKLNDCCYYFYVYKIYVSRLEMHGNVGGRELMLYLNNAGQRINSNLNSLNASFNYATGIGVKSIHRTSSTNVRLYNDKSGADRTQTANTILRSDLLNVLTNGSSSDGGISFYARGESLVSENDDFVDTWNAYYNAL